MLLFYADPNDAASVSLFNDLNCRTAVLNCSKTAVLKEINTWKKGRCFLWTPTTIMKAAKDYPKAWLLLKSPPNE